MAKFPWLRNLFVFGLMVLALILGSRALITYREQQQSRAYSSAYAPPPQTDGTFPCVAADVRGEAVVPAVTRCKMPTDHVGAVDRFEVDLRFGAFILRQTDLELTGSLDVPLTRAYTSADWIGANRSHAFGGNANHTYDLAPLGSRNPYTYQCLVLEDGETLYFTRVSAGSGYSDAVYQHTETSTRFYRALTYWNGNGWTTRLADGSTITFPESYAAKNLAQGAATAMQDASGRILKLDRDQSRNLRAIQTPDDHWIKFSYDGQDRVTSVSDDQGRWATYSYNHDGMLVDVVHSSGDARHYSYQGKLMTAIADQHGHTLLRNGYRAGLLVAQQFEDGATYAYDYDWSSDRRYVATVVVALPDGTMRKIDPSLSVPQSMR